MEREEPSYRDVLKREFEIRCKKNPSYSLRAFARNLKFHPARLSDILNGRQGLSRRSASALARNLGFSNGETEQFCTLVLSEHARSAVGKQVAREKLNDFAQEKKQVRLKEDVFSILSEWYHLPILELTLTEGFVPTKEWIAKRLGISNIEAERAIQRLLDVGLLIRKGKKLEATTTFPFVSSDVPSAAIRNFHQQVLQLASSALILQEVSKRDFSAITCAIDPDDLPKIAREIEDFRNHLERKYKASPRKREVYCVAVQVFSLTPGGNK